MSASLCPKTYKAYKLPAAKVTEKSRGWNFFTKFQALQSNLESFKLHHKATSEKTAKDSTIKNEYNSILATLVSQKLIPPSLFSYVNSLKVTKKRKLRATQSQEPHPPQTVTSKGKTVVPYKLYIGML